jgi:hypothetical protein
MYATERDLRPVLVPRRRFRKVADSRDAAVCAGWGASTTCRTKTHLHDAVQVHIPPPKGRNFPSLILTLDQHHACYPILYARVFAELLLQATLLDLFC